MPFRGRPQRTRKRVGDIDIASVLPWDAARRLDTAAPLQLPVPSGRSARLAYNDDGTVTAAVKLQELFGLADTPRLGPNQEPVIFELLAPNGRPVQTTRDLRSFWTRTYPRYGRSCAAGTRNTPGRKIPGRRRRRTKPRGGDKAEGRRQRQKAEGRR
jgi:ATP-dependent helicase HrpB